MSYALALTDKKDWSVCHMDNELCTCCGRLKRLTCVSRLMSYALAVTDIKGWPVCHMENDL